MKVRGRKERRATVVAPSRPTIGVALGSGSARGWAHIGVLQSLIRADVPIDYVAGASIGAFVGAAFCAGQLHLLNEEVRRLDWRRMASMLEVTLPRTGFLTGKNIVNFIRRFVNDRPIEALPLPFCAVATSLRTGREIWLQRGSTVEAVRASLSIPGIFTPVQHGRWLLVDGGLANPVPASVCRAMGADIVIAVNLNADLVGPPWRGMDGAVQAEASRQHKREKQAFRQYWRKQGVQLRRRLPWLQRTVTQPMSIFEVLLYSVQIMQDRLTRQRLAADPPDIQITPALRQVLLWEFHRADEAITEGERATQAILPMIKDMLVHESPGGRT